MIVGMGVTPECGLRRHHKQQRSMVGGSTRMRWGFVFCVVIIGIALGTARTSAFSSSRATGSRIHLATTPKFRTKASHATPLPPPNANTNTNNALTLLSYGERSRPFRRDLFQYENWVDHRQSNRFGASLLSIFSSGVFQQLLKEIYLTTGIATFICVYNALLVTGYEDFGGVHHEPFWQLGQYVLAVPSIVFTLTSPALSLLLGRFCLVLLNH